MLIFMTITYELSEYALQHQLPNFGECWWDHWILDALCCNLFGALIGWKTLKFFNCKIYDWRRLGSEICTVLYEINFFTIFGNFFLSKIVQCEDSDQKAPEYFCYFKTKFTKNGKMKKSDEKN